MATASSSHRETKGKRGRIDWNKVRATTETDIRRQINDDGGEEAGFARGRVVVPSVHVRRVRERLGLTQAEFARRFGLRARTIQEWEQGRAQPEGPARVLLRVIEQEPRAVERAIGQAAKR